MNARFFPTWSFIYTPASGSSLEAFQSAAMNAGLKMAAATTLGLRKVWILGNIADPNPKIIYSRGFPNQESRARKCQGPQFVSVPKDEEFNQQILIALGIKEKYPKFLSWRDSIDKINQQPVLDILTTNDTLWPVAVIQHNGFLLCCLPLVEKVYKDKSKEFTDLFHNPSITIGIAVLESLCSIIGNSLVTSKIKDIDTFISVSMPFGRPSDLDPTNAFALLTATNEQLFVEAPPKSPSKNSKFSLSFGVQESIRCVIWDQTQFNTQTEIYGSVLVKADLEGSQTDVSVVIGNDAKAKPVMLKELLYDPCVHNSSIAASDQTGLELSKKIKFTPQLRKKIPLLNYMASLDTPPILGEYRMKGQMKVDLELRLSLSDSIWKKKISYFEARFPFFNRGRIKKVDCKPSWGLIRLTDDKQTLVWNIGQNYQGKANQLTLKATLHFAEASERNPSHPFCHDNNAYAQLEFLIPNYTLSGTYIDLKTVQVSPPYKTKLETGRELRATNYKIWNCNGDIPFYSPGSITDIEASV